MKAEVTVLVVGGPSAGKKKRVPLACDNVLIRDPEFALTVDHAGQTTGPVEFHTTDYRLTDVCFGESRLLFLVPALEVARMSGDQKIAYIINHLSRGYAQGARKHMNGRVEAR